MKPPKHIAILALGTLADVAMIVPVVRALRASQPKLKIMVVTRSEHRVLFQSIEVDIVAHSQVLPIWWIILRNGVDAVADLNPSRKSLITSLLTHITAINTSRLRIDAKHLSQLSRRTRKRFEPVSSVTERACETVTRLGVSIDIPYSMPLIKRPVPVEINLLAGEKSGVWVAVSPFARYKGKIYPIPLMVEVIKKLASKYSRVFIVGAGDIAQLFGEGMEQRFSGVTSVIGRLYLEQELALLSNVDAVLTMDSATMHLAAMIGVPTVSVWGATHPYNGAYGYGLYAEWAVQHNISCRPCSKDGHKRCIWGDYRCLAHIEPKEIILAVERVIADGSRNIIRRKRKNE